MRVAKRVNPGSPDIYDVIDCLGVARIALYVNDSSIDLALTLHIKLDMAGQWLGANKLTLNITIIPENSLSLIGDIN